MPYYVAHKVVEALSLSGVCASKAKILILGVAFKRDIADTRNSPALKVMELLHGKVAEMLYSDPYVPEVHVHDHRFSSVELSEETLKDIDCVVITTDHSSYDYRWLTDHARLIVDARNAVKETEGVKDKVFKLGKR
jgi:UDP-N-acetyl-D-glucosamine dehydrogenase